MNWWVASGWVRRSSATSVAALSPAVCSQTRIRHVPGPQPALSWWSCAPGGVQWATTVKESRATSQSWKWGAGAGVVPGVSVAADVNVAVAMGVPLEGGLGAATKSAAKAGSATPLAALIRTGSTGAGSFSKRVSGRVGWRRAAARGRLLGTLSGTLFAASSGWSRDAGKAGAGGKVGTVWDVAIPLEASGGVSRARGWIRVTETWVLAWGAGGGGMGERLGVACRAAAGLAGATAAAGFAGESAGGTAEGALSGAAGEAAFWGRVGGLALVGEGAGAALLAAGAGSTGFAGALAGVGAAGDLTLLGAGVAAKNLVGPGFVAAFSVGSGAGRGVGGASFRAGRGWVWVGSTFPLGGKDLGAGVDGIFAGGVVGVGDVRALSVAAFWPAAMRREAGAAGRATFAVDFAARRGDFMVDAQETCVRIHCRTHLRLSVRRRLRQCR